MREINSRKMDKELNTIWPKHSYRTVELYDLIITNFKYFSIRFQWIYLIKYTYLYNNNNKTYKQYQRNFLERWSTMDWPHRLTIGVESQAYITRHFQKPENPSKQSPHDFSPFSQLISVIPPPNLLNFHSSICLAH